MRKATNKDRSYNKIRRLREQRKNKRLANINRDVAYRHRQFRRKYLDYFKLKDYRNDLLRLLYTGRYRGAPITIDIKTEFGIEDRANIEYFLDKAAQIIDCKSKEITFDIESCTRVWPSAVTLFCSLIQWVELSTKGSQTPKIRSTPSGSANVNGYLNHCGFYDYVKRPPDVEEEKYFPDSEIVKIQRETKRSNIDTREDAIVELLKKHSLLSARDIELFCDKVLIEAFNNVTEHGLAYKDKGWWTLGQYHKRHGFISLCIADNGIGIRNSLMTGPQREEIGKQYRDEPTNEHSFIKMALTESVSGALHAPQMTGRFRKRYPSGAHRGNGLKRISDTCKELKIPFTILSHNGYAFKDENGKIIKNNSKTGRVFAGTLNHFLIPAKKETE